MKLKLSNLSKRFGTHTVLESVSLEVSDVYSLVLIGPSGGGKTTLVKLIPRFYEIQQGSVRVDSVDSRMYPLKVLRENVSMVLQDSGLSTLRGDNS